jgi:hypothetical protein
LLRPPKTLLEGCTVSPANRDPEKQRGIIAGSGNPAQRQK